MLVVLYPALGADAESDQDGKLATFEFLVVFSKKIMWLEELSVPDWVISCLGKENRYTKKFSSFPCTTL